MGGLDTEANVPVEDDFVKSGKPLINKRPLRALGIDLTIFALLTAYAVALWSKGEGKDGYEFFTVLYVFVTLRLIARHISVTPLFWKPLGKLWNGIVHPLFGRFPKWMVWTGLLVATLVGLFLMAMLSSTGNSSRAQRLQSFVGVLVFLAIAVATSRKWRNINLQTVAVGMFLQFVFALLVLRSDFGNNIFKWISSFVTNFLGFSHVGLEFLIGPTKPASFAVNVLPAIIFFCSFISVVYYWGGMQYLVQKLGGAMMKILDTSGAESVVAAASPFVGQVENALLVLPFIEHMTKSELHAIMTCGFATISGSVLFGYVGIVGPEGAYLLLTACIMSIPASLVLTKIRYPEEEESITKGKIVAPEHHEKAVNFLHAAANGAATGAQLVILISATILALVTLYTVANELTGWIFDMISVHRDDGSRITLSFCLSYIFWPISWCIGIPPNDARLAGEVLAEKLLVNEYVAYARMGKEFADGHFTQRTKDLMTFALCGFANIGSVGIQVSALGALCKERKGDLASLAGSAMLVGSLCTWMTAAVAGCLI